MKIPRSLLVPTYAVGVSGAFLQISGGIWDVSAHIEGIPETFFTPQHMVLYVGVALSLLASATGALMRVTTFRQTTPVERSILAGLLLSLAGGGLQLVAGPLDFQWHQQFGFDPFLFTPSHSLLIAGIVLNGIGMAVGTSRMVQLAGSVRNLGRLSEHRFLTLLSIISFSTLWLVINGLVYMITDVNGIAYTFHLSEEWVNRVSSFAFGATVTILAGTGTLVLFSARRVLPCKGSVSVIAGLGAVVTLAANLSFRAFYLLGIGDQSSSSAIVSFVPLYILFLVPIIGFDLLFKTDIGRWKALLVGAFLAPFVSFLDGFYSLLLWTGGNVAITEVVATGRILIILGLIVPMAVAGSIASVSRSKFLAMLSASQWAK